MNLQVSQTYFKEGMKVDIKIVTSTAHYQYPLLTTDQQPGPNLINHTYPPMYIMLFAHSFLLLWRLFTDTYTNFMFYPQISGLLSG